MHFACKALLFCQQIAAFRVMSTPSDKKPITLRLRPVLLAYLDELDRIGGYGKGRMAIVRGFVESGIRREIRRGIIDKKSAVEAGETLGKDDDE